MAKAKKKKKDKPEMEPAGSSHLVTSFYLTHVLLQCTQFQLRVQTHLPGPPLPTNLFPEPLPNSHLTSQQEMEMDYIAQENINEFRKETNPGLVLWHSQTQQTHLFPILHTCYPKVNILN